jgi:four helix bundle protein
MGEARYKNLIVWQKADRFAYSIYLRTKNFPKEEMYGLTSQLRRAALSIPVNIVEGHARDGKNELKHFLSIALGSLTETEYLIEFSQCLGYFKECDYQELKNLRQEVGNLLWKFYKSIC